MARFLSVFKPSGTPSAASLIDALQHLLQELQAEVDHRTPAHLSALMRGGKSSCACNCLPMCRPKQRARCWSWC